MVIGADTGFFIAYANNHPRAVEIWNELIDGQHRLIVSAVTINEILVYFYRRGGSDKGQEWVQLMIETETIDVIPVSIEIAVHSARYRHGIGLPTVDSVILGTFLINECQKILTTDSHFHIVDRQKILPVEFLD